MEEFARSRGYKVGIDCNELTTNAAFKLYELRANCGASIILFLQIISKYLDDNNIGSAYVSEVCT
jgi:hypothetical protein